jgi:hypothetical protein
MRFGDPVKVLQGTTVIVSGMRVRQHGQNPGSARLLGPAHQTWPLTCSDRSAAGSPISASSCFVAARRSACVSESARSIYRGAPPRFSDCDRPDAPEQPVVHTDFVLALFRICSSYERNVRQHHDTSESGSVQFRGSGRGPGASTELWPIRARYRSNRNVNQSRPVRSTPASSRGALPLCVSRHESVKRLKR